MSKIAANRMSARLQALGRRTRGKILPQAGYLPQLSPMAGATSQSSQRLSFCIRRSGPQRPSGRLGSQMVVARALKRAPRRHG